MNAELKEIRRASVAGTFYPANPAELSKLIAGMFAEVDKIPLDGHPLALIAPHAGYIYSGRVAAKAYKILEGEEYETVIVVSPSHSVFFKGVSVYDGEGYETPLGVVPIDQELSKQITSINSSIVYASKMGHATGSTRGEHALEVQLPFLQVSVGKFKLVAIVMGDQEESSVNALGEILASTLGDKNCLLVASTDLSHFHAEEKARTLDFAVQEAIEKYDPKALAKTLSSGKGEACGGGPVASVMLATKKLGGSRVQFIDYATSGATTGDFDEVVGYLSAAIVASDKKVNINKVLLGRIAAQAPNIDKSLTEDDKKELIKIAREAIEYKLTGHNYVSHENPRLSEKQGLFVTLTIEGQLRGCIGQIKGRDPLYKLVAELAVAAAFEDPRFPPLGANEFKNIEIEISLLSPLVRVRDLNEISVGRDGLMVKLDLHSGLLLPQVATEYGWSSKQFLQETCLKAGLSRNSYQDKFAEIFRFTADIIK